MTTVCRIIVWGFALLYAAALAVFLIGTFGLFGQPTGPLSGVYLLPLGLPWVLAVEPLFPEPVWPWLAAAAPALNLVLLWLSCRQRSGH